MSRARERGVLLAIVTAGLCLRLIRLGSLSFAGDEETTTLAALALLEGWPPELPGGLVYLRGLPFTLLEAGSIAIFGVSEFSLRLVPALCAVPRILAAWWLARGLVSAPVALAAAAIFALAPLDVEMSRDARMYSLFATLDLFFVAGVVRISQGRRGALVAAICGVLAIVTQSLGVIHAPIAWLALLSPGLPRGAPLRLAVIGGLGFAAFGVEASLSAFSYRDMGAVPDAFPTPAGPLGAHLARLLDLVSGGSIGRVAGLLALGGGGLALLASMRFERLGAKVAGAGAGLLAAAGMPVLAAPAGLSALLVEGISLRSLPGRVWVLLAACALPVVGWAIASGATAGDVQSGVEHAGRFLLGFPAPNWFEFAIACPGLCVLATVGIVVALERGHRSGQPAPWLILIAAALAPALVGGAVQRAEDLRYQLHAMAPLILLAVLPAEALAEWLPRRRALALAVGLLAALLAVRPMLSVAAVLREPGPIRSPFAVTRVAPDHRGAARFIEEHWQPGDWVAAEDAFQQRLYLGRTDLWLRRFEDAAAFLHREADGLGYRDSYTGALHVSDLDSLRAVAQAADRSVVWVVTSGEVEASPLFYRSPETQRELERWRDASLAWFVGADGLTRVYRLVDGRPEAAR